MSNLTKYYFAIPIAEISGLVIFSAVFYLVTLKLLRLLRSLVYPESKIPVKGFAAPLTALLILALINSSYFPFSNSVNGYFEGETYRIFFRLAILVATTLVISRATYIGFLALERRHDISSPDNLLHRKALTQIHFIRRIVVGAIWICAAGLGLQVFESVAAVGRGLLASAGLASVVLGFAAQESVSNLLAGFQIAFTQPLRIDDAVVVEGEWGWIEEINLTYVVVRIWDLRRLVLPIKYFTTKPFQNWTRESAKIIGSVELYVDHLCDIESLRRHFEGTVSSSELWDGDVKVLQVTDFTEKTLKLRCLVSARNSPDAWDLRCEVRENLVSYLQRRFNVDSASELPTLRIAAADKEFKAQLRNSST